MKATSKKTIIYVSCLVAILLVPGCTNWKTKYSNLNVAYENLEGQLEFEKSQRGQLTEQISKDQQTIEELQQKIAQRHQSAAEATGFGRGYDVAFDPSAGTITVTLPNAILFSPGKASLRKKTSTELNHIYSVLQEKYHGKNIDVVGHTDSDPIKKSKWKDNWELSAQRALAVVRYFASRGIAKDKIRGIGCGAARPVTSNTTKSGKARNRRVEIVVNIR